MFLAVLTADMASHARDELLCSPPGGITAAFVRDSTDGLPDDDSASAREHEDTKSMMRLSRDL